MKKMFFNLFFTLIQVFTSVAASAETSKDDCYLDICKGTGVYVNYIKTYTQVTRSEFATVVGFDGQNYVLRFETGEKKGKHEANWTRDRLALTNACTNTSFQLCFNDKVFMLVGYDDNPWSATVVGIQGENKDKVVLRFETGELAGDYSVSSQIYKTTGRSGAFGVGDIALNKDRKSTQVRVIGYDSKNNYLIQYLEGEFKDQRGGGWQEQSLIPLTPVETKPVTVGDINSKMALQEGAQIIIKDKLYIPGNRGCGAPVESTQNTQCFVCQTNKILNGTLYEAEGILGVTHPVVSSDQKEVSVQILDSDDLNRIICRSKTGQAVAIDSFETLQKALNDSGIYFKDPAPLVKSFGKIKSK